MSSCYLYDSMSQQKKPFKPQNGRQVTLYACGMTVYDDCHLGHARVLIFFDAFKRILTALGYDVVYVRNVTDIDDKIIKKANDQARSWQDVVAQYTQSMLEDESALAVMPPNHLPKATDYIDDMIAMITTLINKGFAYESEGDVYFSVSTYETYGQLSKRQLDDMEVGKRLGIDERKEQAHDFVLWKAAKPEEPSWPSPWGAGRPGWHIECSAMIQSCLGGTIDIHGGGIDLKFPHHENERAQSECAHGQVLANYWMHVGHVQINDEKMSKSLGNFITIKQLLSQHDADAIRLFLLKTHYRKPLSYTAERLAEASTLLTKWQPLMGDDHLEYLVEDDLMAFKEALNDDINTPLALSVMHQMYKRVIACQHDQTHQIKQYKAAFQWMQQALGLGVAPKKSIDRDKINAMVAQREEARSKKDFVQADHIRDQLKAQGIVLEDTASGVTWRQG
ncbi:MAG: cysteine--tRNA ligase [Candidatus Comchoanobacterales bacterium]